MNEDSFSFLGWLLVALSGTYYVWSSIGKVTPARSALLAVVIALYVDRVGKMLIDYIGYWPASLVLGSTFFLIWWMIVKWGKAKAKKENVDMKSDDGFSFLGMLCAVGGALSVYWVSQMLSDYIGLWPVILLAAAFFLTWWMIAKWAKAEAKKENLERSA